MEQTTLEPNRPIIPQIKKSSHRSFIVGLLFTIVLVGVSAGSYWLGTKRSTIPIGQRAGEPSPAPTPTPNPTENWKTYRAPVYEFQYPPDWQEEADAPSSEKGIILVTNNASFQDFGNVAAGALLYTPTQAVDANLLSTILSENLKRGYKLLSQQSVQLGEQQALETVTSSPLGSIEVQLQFDTTTGVHTFLSLVTSKSEEGLRRAQFDLTRSTFHFLTPGKVQQFRHERGTFEFSYPVSMTVESTKTTTPNERLATEVYTIHDESASVVVAVAPYRGRTVEEEATSSYQQFLKSNKVTIPLKKQAIAFTTAYVFTVRTGEQHEETSVYLPLPVRDRLLKISYGTDEPSATAARLILASLKISDQQQDWEE